MQRPETRKKLDQIARSDCWIFGLILVAFALVAVAFEFTGMFSRMTNLGEAVATVRWSEIMAPPNGAPPWTSFLAELNDGKQIMVDSAYTPPPVPGERIVLQVRRNIIGYHSYKWLVGRKPALTTPP